MSFSSRRRNYLLTPHRRDGLIECMKSMLLHSFVLDALDTTGGDTFAHFEQLIDEHRALGRQQLSGDAPAGPSRLKRLVPGVGTFHTRLPLRQAFEAYNAKYGVTRRRYVCISFNEIRHILNLAQIIAMVHPDPARLSLLAGRGAADAAQPGTSSGAGGGAEADRAALEAWATMAETTPRKEESDDDAGGSDEEKEGKGDSHNAGAAESLSQSDQRRDRSDSNAIEEDLSLLPACAPLPGPKLICFDGDQTLYSDGANFEKSPKLAKYLYLLLRRGATIAVVTAAGYEYQAPKYELRLSGLLAYFRERGLDRAARERFYLFGGECNYLLRLGTDYQLHAVREDGPGGWVVATRHLPEAPGNWSEAAVTTILDRAEACFRTSLRDQNLRARVLRKRRSVGLVPRDDEKVPREALDETVLRVQAELEGGEAAGDAATTPPRLPFCAFNGGRDAWVDVGNKRVGVQVLQSYLGVPVEETLHIGDQFLNTGNDFAARSVCPCVWITSPEETTYVLKSILRLAGVPAMALLGHTTPTAAAGDDDEGAKEAGAGAAAAAASGKKVVDFEEAGRRSDRVKMDVYTGEYIKMPN